MRPFPIRTEVTATTATIAGPMAPATKLRSPERQPARKYMMAVAAERAATIHTNVRCRASGMGS